ncbi:MULTISPECIES: DUF3152 domain-containing protein [Corynebacterium]|uniref:DUF3152 domain-containing protein n=1 Tax=Corynebacterium freneyi TaxID=134034 RepID=A0ABS4UA24_9CORY|nr:MULTISPECIES: DUF3152 domain-containing protein [Corynebacterium]MBP2333370.1 hypothetical protein [Corynebacterium freneyi]MCG7438558.1 DUF3152 domain-containing protein [Corynebacterium freneyi]OFU60408.1 hypothetical protein HMPREF3121_00110 [Corynebacterium sp. HMSC11E11]QXA52580.1 DUF3152 domain-containing protein [Corynebacterium freneyi]UBI02873.1 DUF3152 domain-containing protein [Corynebacterium freneyi]
MSKESFFVRFARQWGWRAYAIPVLLVLTVIVVVDVVRDVREEKTNVSAATSELPHGPIPEGGYVENLDVGQLPPGGPFTEESSGVFVPVDSAAGRVGEGKELTMRYAVEIEDTVDPASFGGADAFGGMIDATLADERGWIRDEKFAFERVARDDNPDLVFQLVSTDTAHEQCGYEIPLETSCSISDRRGDDPTRVLINEARWVRGALTFEGDLGAYRQYLINHEVGHAIGYASHEACPDDGAVAPIMMQQTLSLDNSELHKLNPNEVYPDDGARCAPNPWPYPLG